MTIQEQAEQVVTREDLASFVEQLVKDMDGPEKWENTNLKSYLTALAAWVRSMDGYYLNRDEQPPTQPSWQTVADILLAATAYE